MHTLETLEHQYGLAIKPEELAEHLRIDVPTLLHNIDRWGGFEVVPGTFRFFEKKIDAILNSQPIPNENPTPTSCFYFDGEFWWIGEMGKTQPFKNLKGFKFIHFQLCHPNRYFEAEVVYNCGSIAVDLDNGENGNSSKSIKELRDKEFQLMGEDYEPEIDDTARKNYVNQIKNLEIKLTKSNRLTPEKKSEIKKEIKELSVILSNKDRGIRTRNAENARTNVSKRMQEALQKIYENEKVSYLERYLNKATLQRRGKKNFYQPDLNDKPHWILHKNELPS